jgi:serine/threonine protein phosphatase PrpC
VEDSRLVIGAATDPGPVREQNEDAIYYSDVATLEPDAPLLLAVADGMGGYQRGEVASRMAIDSLVERFNAHDTDDVPLMLRQAFRQANERIFADGSAEGEHNMMGTTLVAAVLRGADLTVGNVGDSRGYLLRANRLNQVTNDHSLVAEQVAMGAMTSEEARDSQHKNIITRALGHRQKVDIDVFEIKLLPDDRLLLSSDGLHDYIEEDELTQILTSNPPDKAALAIVERAIQGGSTDNVTALCAWYAPISALEPPTPAVEPARDKARLLVPALVLLGLIIFIAIIGYVLFVS